MENHRAILGLKAIKDGLRAFALPVATFQTKRNGRTQCLKGLCLGPVRLVDLIHRFTVHGADLVHGLHRLVDSDHGLMAWITNLCGQGLCIKRHAQQISQNLLGRFWLTIFEQGDRFNDQRTNKRRIMPRTSSDCFFEIPSRYHHSPRQKCPEILEHQKQMVRIGRTGFKFPGLIPLPRSLILGVNQQATNARDVSGL